MAKMTPEERQDLIRRLDRGELKDQKLIEKATRIKEFWIEVAKKNADQKAAAEARRALKEPSEVPKKSAIRKLIEDVDEPDPPEPQAIPAAAKKRGRPKGVKNKPKDPEEPQPIPLPISSPGGISDRQKLKLIELIREARDRKYETLRLYRPLPVQSAFHMSDAHIRILRGGNRSGKTSATIAELAWALTGTHPQEDKYPKTGLRAIVVAKNMDKIGEVIWRTLGRPGAFKMVDDPVTGEPRIEAPGDREAKLKTRPAPAFLPRRLVDTNRDVTWESKKAQIPKKLIIPSNGNECAFYSGQADPFSIQGTKLDLVVFDEEIENEGWFPEAIARLVDRGGRFVWGATPQTGTQKLYELYLKALEDQELGVESPLVEEFVLSIYENPFISEQDRQMFLHSLDDEDQIRVRIEGEHAIAGFKIFGPYFFPRGIHAIEPFAIPDSWTRFCAVDPGSQVAAVVFGACPPKNKPRGSDLDESLFGDFLYIYDEIYIRRCDATRLAKEMKGHVGSQMIHTMLLDHHGGNLTEIGSGKTPEQQYKEAFQKARVPVPLVGRYFTYGSDDLAGGILRIKEFLRLREDGTPKIRILTGSCPQLVAAMSRYQWKVVNGIMTDKPLAKNCDPVDSLRYLVMHPGTRYHATEEKERKRVTSWDDFKAWRRREKDRKKKESGTGVTL